MPELAAQPLSQRLEQLMVIEAAEGAWVAAEPTRELMDETLADGYALGNLDGGTYGVDVICTVEYGEVLLLDAAGDIARAYPMPGAPPSWLAVTAEAVLGGHIGDGALPDSTVFRIDRESLGWDMIVIPAPFDSAESFPPGWRVATDAQIAAYPATVAVAPDASGTPVESWIGPVVADLDALGEWF